MSDMEEKFTAAAEKARTIQGVSMDNKGKLYGLFKQATEGPIGDRPRPAFYNIVAGQKHDAWAKYGDMGKEEAKQMYIDLVESL
jgi:diazepam-binding inhibitor (GABA receptor modulating acyl-CoA-binding protein)